jgi:hypothetical protein
MNDGTEVEDAVYPTCSVNMGSPSSSSAPSANGGAARSRPGILIFSLRQQVLHMNHRASELTAQSPHAERDPVKEICAASVRELRAAIQQGLDSRRDANIWEIFELKRVLFEARRRILVRGFGLADRHSFADSRIVIVLEELGV